MCAGFISFTFAFEIDHIQQGGERMESGGGGHSNSFGGHSSRMPSFGSGPGSTSIADTIVNSGKLIVLSLFHLLLMYFECKGHFILFKNVVFICFACMFIKNKFGHNQLFQSGHLALMKFTFGPLNVNFVNTF